MTTAMALDAILCRHVSLLFLSVCMLCADDQDSTGLVPSQPARKTFAAGQTAVEATC